MAVGGFANTSLTGEVRILDAETVREVWSLKGHTSRVFDAVFTLDGRRLATGSVDETVRLWDLGTGQEILKLSDFTDSTLSVRFVSDGRLISTHTGRGIRVWDASPLPE